MHHPDAGLFDGESVGNTPRCVRTGIVDDQGETAATIEIIGEAGDRGREPPLGPAVGHHDAKLSGHGGGRSPRQQLNG